MHISVHGSARVCVFVLICLIGIRVRVYIRICNWVVLMSVSQKTRGDQPEVSKTAPKSEQQPILERELIKVLLCPY